MKYSKVIFWFTVLVILASCYHIMDVEFPDTERKITVNSFIRPDTNIHVSVTYSKAPDDSKDYYIPDASVTLFWDDSSVALTYKDSGIYTTDIRPRLNKSYKIIVKKNDTTVMAETYIPDTGFVVAVEVKLETGYCPQEMQKYSDLNITIKDNPEQDNYYEIFIPQHAVWDTSNYFYVVNNNNIQFFSVDDSVLIAEGYFPSTLSRRLIISDKYFDKNQITLHLHPLLSCGKTVIYDTVITDALLFLFVRSVSEDYYKYSKSYQWFINYMEGDVNAVNFISRPVNVYGNIEGGYGIFAGYVQWKKLMQIQEVEILSQKQKD